ncbi:S8 family serine peptidase [Streptomyces sp. NPDC054765]
MSFTRTLRAVGGVAVAGALLFTAAPTASADYIRDGQWALDAFNPQKVWKESTGKNVIVAVIDSGVNGDHVDLKGNVLPGKSFAGGGGTADHETGDDDHGTAMAALIAGHGHGPNHADGIMGLAPDAKILPIKRNESVGGSENAIDGPIRYAVDHGAKVINMSFAGGPLNAQEQSAVNYAVKKDVLLVAGAGNDGSSKPLYPAASPGVLAVGAVAKDGKVLGESNYGPHLRLIAPGEKVYSAGISPKYRQGTGTSDATAYVSAAAALVRSKFPDLTAGQVANRLTKTAITPDGKTDVNSPDPKYGYGVIRPYRALSENIPAGSKNGPLTMPKDTEPSAGAGADAPGGTPSASSGSDLSGVSPVMVVGIALGAVVVLGIVIGVIVANKKRRNGPPPGGTGFGGPSGGVGVPPQYPSGSYQQPGGPGGYQSAPPNYPPRQ